jgi:hypothetical protein
VIDIIDSTPPTFERDEIEQDVHYNPRLSVLAELLLTESIQEKRSKDCSRFFRARRAVTFKYFAVIIGYVATVYLIWRKLFTKDKQVDPRIFPDCTY